MYKELIVNCYQKSLLYRSEHRGMREADILIGGFARNHLSELSDGQLQAFEELLEWPDQDIVNWCLDLATVPPQFDTDVFQKLKAYAQRSS